MQPWAYIYLPRLQLDNLQLMHPALSLCPVVLYDEVSQEVSQMNTPAADAGVWVGMALSDAWVMTGELQAFIHRTDFQRKLLEQLAEQLYQSFGDIALHGSQGMWVRLQAMQRLFTCESEALGSLQALLSGLTYSIRTAPTPLAAQLLACAPEAETLDDLPIRYTTLSSPLRQKLQRMGLHTLAQVQRIPSASLGAKLGLELVQFLAQVRGQSSLPLTFFQPAEGFTQDAQLATEVHNWSGLRFPLNRLLMALETYLRGRQQMTRCVEIILIDRQNQEQSVQVHMAEGEYRAVQFYALAQLRFEQQRLTSPALILRVVVKTFEAMQAESSSLTASSSGSSEMSLGNLLNVLQTRLGSTCMYGVAVADGWLPESVQQRVAAATPLLQMTTEWRPPWLLDLQPIEITNWQVISQPERLVEPWWQQRRSAFRTRDYVIARDAHGRRGWIFFDHALQGWFIQGWADG